MENNFFSRPWSIVTSFVVRIAVFLGSGSGFGWGPRPQRRPLWPQLSAQGRRPCDDDQRVQNWVDERQNSSQMIPKIGVFPCLEIISFTIYFEFIETN